MSAVLNNSAIRRLPKQLANQIAAGEVVERPSSIVKELLENSIDAGATRIEIDIEQGGMRAIRIRDNGCGIPGEQLSLAVSRHATSKISSLTDLQNLYSMGFRGEALASIGSVSHMQLISCCDSQSSAWQLVCNNLSESDEGELTRATHPVGTSVEVTSLFYNAPARRKFLRSERTEYRHIEEVVRRMALSHFEIQFLLKHNHRQVFSLPAAHDKAAQLRRIRRLCGKAFADSALQLEFNHHDMCIHGWVLPASESRSQADLQYFYVNKRIIRDRVVSHAIRQAYSERIYPGRHPAYVLQLEMPAEQVDVNVHPTKHEVRFRESRMVHDFISHCVNQALQSTQEKSEQDQVNVEKVSPAYYKPATGNVRYPVKPYSRDSILQSHDSVAETVPEAVSEMGSYQPVACLFNNYILVQCQSHWRVVNIHQTLSRIYQRVLAQAELPLQMRPILFPISINFPVSKVDWFEKNTSQFLNWGIDISRAAEQTILLRGLPAMFKMPDAQALVTHLLEKQPQHQQDWIACLSELAACHDQRHWNQEAMQQLLQDMQQNDLWTTAAQLSGLWQELEINQLEKWFSGSGDRT